MIELVGPPGERRGFFHKSLIGLAKKAIGTFVPGGAIALGFGETEVGSRVRLIARCSDEARITLLRFGVSLQAGQHVCGEQCCEDQRGRRQETG